MRDVKFDNVGDQVTGIVLAAPSRRQLKKFRTGEPDFWPNGDPKLQMVVRLQTAERDDDKDDGKRTLYITSANMFEAWILAVHGTDSRLNDIGALLTMVYVGTGPIDQRNPSNPPPRIYSAVYTKRLAASAFAPGLTVDQTARLPELRARGMYDTEIAKAFGVPLALVVAARA